jgi:hypothetical protein
VVAARDEMIDHSIVFVNQIFKGYLHIRESAAEQVQRSLIPSMPGACQGMG